jgi:hypothetical protein
MAEGARTRLNLPLLIVAASVTVVLGLLVALTDSDGLLYFLLVFPISLALLALSLVAVINKRNWLTPLSILAIYWILSVAFLTNYRTVRNGARWILWSRAYKANVLSQPALPNGELKHVEWDGWGFPGAGDTTVYLAFDPTDSLATSAKNHKPGKFAGLPCTVPLVTRLESQWYAILFYTDESWGKSRRDCGMND